MDRWETDFRGRGSVGYIRDQEPVELQTTKQRPTPRPRASKQQKIPVVQATKEDSADDTGSTISEDSEIEETEPTGSASEDAESISSEDTTIDDDVPQDTDELPPVELRLREGNEDHLLGFDPDSSRQPLHDAKVLRASIKDKHFDRSAKKSGSIRTGRQIKCCVLCKQAGRPSQHFLSSCKYLPDEDKQYVSRVRQSYCTEVGDSESEDNVDNEQVSFLNDNVGPSKLRVVYALRRVSTKQSPYFKAFYKHFPLELTLDTGAEVSMMKASPADNIGVKIKKSNHSADYIGIKIKKSNHSALQADGVTPLNIVSECHFTLSRDGIELQLEALVVNDLDVDILAGIPFMSSNDIARAT
ncbi:unnamed protein product [Mytilus coruscus]|uniref:Uncharacterized protein n=1 Tax=Mytilus coruscus TaxID=42192 RepID=A0A6J8D5G0_MYTCO|nr:unnamed protein product [Mytilus coruscus]